MLMIQILSELIIIFLCMHFVYIDLLVSMISVLGRTVERCTLENNTLLHIDLPVSVEKESNPNIYSYTNAKTEQITPPTWLLVTATAGVLLIILLVIVIIIIILRIRRLSKQRPPVTREIDRFHDNDESHGTDVWRMYDESHGTDVWRMHDESHGTDVWFM